jgi:twitching motility protein PilJ
MKVSREAGVARLRANRSISFAIVLMLVGFVGAGINAYIVLQDTSYDQRYLELAAGLRLHTQQIETSSREAAAGEGEAFESLAIARDRFEQAKTVLERGSSGLPSPRDLLKSELNEVDGAWDRVSEAAATIITNKERIIFLHEVALTLNESIPVLQQEYNNVVEILLDRRAPADQVAVAQRQSWLAERIARNVDRMLDGGQGAPVAADQFNIDASTFGTVLRGMIEGNPAMQVSQVKDPEAQQSLQEISQLFEFVASSVEDIFQASPSLLEATTAAESIIFDAPKVQEATSRLSAAIDDLEGKRMLSTTTVLAFVILIPISLALIGVQSFRGTQVRLQETAQTSERNQSAILRLLDELADLADGDLTTTATVSEDFTGAIADSINYTIDQLRVLVSQINDTALRVSTAAQNSQATALTLAEASENQAQEIAGASAAVNEMAVTIDQVSSNAVESAAVAKRSVSIANTGAEMVQNTIKGMDNIREQIQETSKRIKRLGESSQEIGDIVSLINDIADQTNILALNAAIQASMAGDAGRGFAVVADEVQRLAERSSGATKQIEALVKTIQSDTNEAVISMEQTTTEVVRGARLAQDAGAALEEIEKVSQELAELIQNISNAARQQAASAGHISNTMHVIQEITSQTSTGATETARSIGNLSEMTDELRRSVAGFKLPQQVVANHEVEEDGEIEEESV